MFRLLMKLFQITTKTVKLSNRERVIYQMTISCELRIECWDCWLVIVFIPHLEGIRLDLCLGVRVVYIYLLTNNPKGGLHCNTVPQHHENNIKIVI